MDRLLTPIVVPALGALLVLAIPRRAASWRGPLAVLTALAGFAVALAGLDLRAEAAWPWMRLGPLDLVFALRSDALSCWMVAFVALMGLLVTSTFLGSGRRDRGLGLVLLTTAAATGALYAANLLLLVIFWDLVTLALFLLVIAGRDEAGAETAKAFTLLGAADMALLVGVVLVGLGGAAHGVTEPLSVAALETHRAATGGGWAAAAFLLMLAAAMAKAGAMPFHTWIPSMAERTDPTVMALLPGSLDKILGIYLLVRIELYWFTPSGGVQAVVLLAGAVTILGGVLMAMVQHDLRRLLAFHAVSQVGYMLLGIATGTVAGVLGGVFHMLNNAIYKACLFLGAGEIERRSGTAELARLGGLGRTMPVTFGCMLVSALAISSIPPLNGFVSKWLVYEGCAAAGQPLLLVVALFGSVLTLASFVKVLHSVFWGPRPAALAEVAEDGAPSTWIPMVVLAALCVVTGVFATWPLGRLLAPVAGLDPAQAAVGAATLASGPATWVGVGTVSALPLAAGPAFPVGITALLLIATGVAMVAASGAGRRRRLRPAFVGGEPLDPETNRFPGTEFFRTVAELPGLGPTLAAASRGRFDLYELGSIAGAPLIGGLRRLHAGRLGTYTAWCLVGLGVLLAALFAGR